MKPSKRIVRITDKLREVLSYVSEDHANTYIFCDADYQKDLEKKWEKIYNMVYSIEKLARKMHE